MYIWEQKVLGIIWYIFFMLHFTSTFTFLREQRSIMIDYIYFLWSKSDQNKSTIYWYFSSIMRYDIQFSETFTSQRKCMGIFKSFILIKPNIKHTYIHSQFFLNANKSKLSKIIKWHACKDLKRIISSVYLCSN